MISELQLQPRCKLRRRPAQTSWREAPSNLGHDITTPSPTITELQSQPTIQPIQPPFCTRIYWSSARGERQWKTTRNLSQNIMGIASDTRRHGRSLLRSVDKHCTREAVSIWGFCAHVRLLF